MENKYLEKIAELDKEAIFLRSAVNLASRAGAIENGMANRIRKVSLGLSEKPLPTKAGLNLQTLKIQSKNKLWKGTPA